ncbi:acyl-CoA N-acyltransferase [Phycomyces nitens]|nr:acyl-CoA N-acyltransferase [Phycomyces nitens]
MSIYSDLEIKQAITPEDKQKCIDVRIRVFVDEQKYPLETETNDQYDATCDHFLATCLTIKDNKTVRVPVGTVRYIAYGESIAKLGRLAVLSDARGMKIGFKLVQHFVEVARAKGERGIVLHSQADKRGFYEKAGFTVDACDEAGFYEDGTPHIRMWCHF